MGKYVDSSSGHSVQKCFHAQPATVSASQLNYMNSLVWWSVWVFKYLQVQDRIPGLSLSLVSRFGCWSFICKASYSLCVWFLVLPKLASDSITIYVDIAKLLANGLLVLHF